MIHVKNVMNYLGWVIVVALSILISHCIYETHEGSYPYIYNSKSGKYLYYLTYIDGAFVISYTDISRFKSEPIIFNDVSPDVSQSCEFIIGRNDDIKNTSMNGYFIINKLSNEVISGMSEKELLSALDERRIDIKKYHDNTRKYSKRRKLYEECAAIQ